MMRFSKALSLAAASLFLANCQQAALTPDNMMCNFRTVNMHVAVPVSRPADLRERKPSALAAEIENSLRVHEKTNTGEAARILALSGGSEHGAFGAGVLKGWGGTGQLPDFQIVTGISTGAILSTFAFVNDAPAAVSGYTIQNEDELITVYAKPKDGKPDIGNYASLLERGSFANLDPLRERLGNFLSDEVLQKVAKRHAAGARLFVGATDADSGDAVAFDMGEMASRYVNTAPDDERGIFKDCYISAIIASSSSPIAAPPAFIDNTMYIDGGVRFGLFSDSVFEAFFRRQHGMTDAYDFEEAELQEELPPIEPDVTAPLVYAIVNGTLNLPAPKCPKADKSLCEQDPPYGGKDGQHKDWNILDLLLQTEHILVNEVYRFSALAVEADACEQAGCFNFLRIEKDMEDFEYIMLNEKGILIPAPCPAWKEVDIELDDPIQFHKRYMRCLIAYGQKSVEDAGWGYPAS